MTEKMLIVNADDFNTDPQRSLGILEAADRGLVTSTTALANLPWDARTLSDLRAGLGAGVGIHLNLTKGRPLTGGRSLVDAGGEFLQKPHAWRRALRLGYAPEEVEAEFSAQIAHLFELGIAPSHIDGNNHIHIFPGISKVVARLASRFGIRRIRLPLEERRVRRRPRLKRHFIGLLCRRAAPIFSGAGLAFPHHFAGIAFPAAGSREDLRHLLRTLPAGVTELMCHPGYSGDAATGSFSTPERELELACLTDPMILRIVRREGIRLLSFADLPAAPPN